MLPNVCRKGYGITWVGRTAAARLLLAFMERVCICVACILLVCRVLVLGKVKRAGVALWTNIGAGIAPAAT